MMMTELECMPDRLDPEIGRRIFEKLRVRMATLETFPPMTNFIRERNPDVVLLVDENAVLFEPQNWPAAEWLYQRCNLSLEGAELRERIRVHPCQWEKILAELRHAGFDVLC